MALKLKEWSTNTWKKILPIESFTSQIQSHSQEDSCSCTQWKSYSPSPKLFSNTLMRHGQDIPYAKDPYERAITRFWAKFIDDKCLPAILKASWGEEKEREKAAEEVPEFLNHLENELKEKRFFGGESIGMVDIVANFIAFGLELFEEAFGSELLPREKFPKLTNWTHQFVSNIVVKESLPPETN
ncbi:hypothetical protein SLA2020_448640 [Shorea laevis]